MKVPIADSIRDVELLKTYLFMDFSYGIYHVMKVPIADSIRDVELLKTYLFIFKSTNKGVN